MDPRRTLTGFGAGIGSVVSTLRRAGHAWMAHCRWGGALCATLLTAADGEIEATDSVVPLSEWGIQRAQLAHAPLPSFSRGRLQDLVRSYSAASDVCRLSTPDELAQRHGIRFRSPAASAPIEVASHSRWEPLAEIGVTVAFEYLAGADRPWVALVPEYHEHQESERFTRRLAAALVASVQSNSVRVFVEAWSRELELPRSPGRIAAHSGIEDMDVYPISRACWDLMTLLRAELDPASGNIRHAARASLLDDRSLRRLLVGEHPSRNEAERAVKLYARAWNAMVRGVASLVNVPVTFPVGAGYRAGGHWNEVDWSVQVTVPTAASAYGRSSRLHLVAESLAAVTSRIRTAQYAFFVLQSLRASGEL